MNDKKQPCSIPETMETQAAEEAKNRKREVMDEREEEPTLIDERCRKNQTRHIPYNEKQSLVIDHLFAPVELSKHEDVLKYEIAVQLQSDVDIAVPPHFQKPVLQLSVLITEHQMDSYNMVKMCPDSLVTLSYDEIRIRRNVFSCLSVAGKPPGSPVLYGEDLLIRLVDADGPILYLSGALTAIENFGETKIKFPVILTDTPDRFAKFRIVDPDAERNVELVGTPVPTFARIAICQTVTNIMLAVKLTKSITTSYAHDFYVKWCIYRDSQGCVTSENFWKFVTKGIDEDAGDQTDENPDVSSTENANYQPETKCQ